MYLSLNVAMVVWAVWEFTPPRWTSDSDVLRITLPIARAGGRLVTFNAALILVTGSKYVWTMVRRYTVIPLGFPVDDIMPYYHRIVAWNIIQAGCLVHTIPQVVNYATKELVILDDMPVWTFGDGFSTKQLLITGILLFVIFGMFFLTTLQKVRHTSVGFRLFWFFHVGGIITAIPLLIIHGTQRGYPITFYFLLVPLAMYIADVAIRRCLFVEQNAKILEWSYHEDKGERVTKLVLDGKHFEYTPGQYAEINIPQISRHEWHPFTIASAPSKKDTRVKFYIKAAGRWTNKLYDIVSSGNDETRKNLVLNLRGPHGAPAQNYLKYRHLVVIGSGIGVTPLLSIWQYLLNEGSKYVTGGNKVEESGTGGSTSKGEKGIQVAKATKGYPPVDKKTKKFIKPIFEPEKENDLLDRLAKHIWSVDVCALAENKLETLQGKCAYGASVLESMTVNVLLLCFAFSTETVIFSVWLFKYVRAAAMIQLVVSAIALAVFGSKIVFSIIAYGPRRYCVSTVFYLESLLVFLDLSSLISAATTFISPSKKEAVVYFATFAAYMLIHAVRIFYIFYATARPPAIDDNRASRQNDGKIQHVAGIWVSKNYSSMSFAAMDLVSTLTEAPSFFTMVSAESVTD